MAIPVASTLTEIQKTIRCKANMALTSPEPDAASISGNEWRATGGGVLKRFRDLCLAPYCRPLWGSAPCGRWPRVVPRWDGRGPVVVSETGHTLTATGPVR